MGGRRSPARVLAPLSLVAVIVAVVVIVQSNRGTSSDAGASGTTSTQSERPASGDRAETTDAKGRGEEGRRRNRRTYVVKPGDILTTVAEKTGVTVDELERLNPDVDPQALQVGERLKLRPDAESGDEDADTATTATTEGDAETP